MACARTHTNYARRGRAACSAPRTPCTRAHVLTTPIRCTPATGQLNQDNRNDNDNSNDNDDGIDGANSSGTDGDNDNNGTTKKVRREHTPLLHPCMPACKHSTAA